MRRRGDSEHIHVAHHHRAQENEPVTYAHDGFTFFCRVCGYHLERSLRPASPFLRRPEPGASLPPWHSIPQKSEKPCSSVAGVFQTLLGYRIASTEG